MSKWTKELKKYEKYMKDYTKKKKVQKDKHYSSFWWDEDWSSSGNSRFGGFSSDVRTTGSSDIVKLVKLTSYQRAIANFVKIVTKQDIPVTFGGSDSLTNGKRVILASDISDKNFDVAVGLALHEASHIKLTDFEALPKALSNVYYSTVHDVSTFKTLVNIIEDRRIDNYIFKSSPGYRAYYHKMYDHYFHSDDINKALVSKSLRDPRIVAHYIFHLTNLTNPLFSKKAMPGLAAMYDLIDVKTIGRLKSTQEVISLAYEVYCLIQENVRKAQETPNLSNGDGSAPPKNQPGDSDKSKNDVKLDAEKSDNSMGGTNPDLSDMTGDMSDSDDGNADEQDGDGGSADDLIELDQKTLQKVQKAFESQKDFLEGNVGKKKTTKKLQSELEQVSKMDLDVQMVGDGNRSFEVIIYDLSNKLYLRNLIALCRRFSSAKVEAEKMQVLEELRSLSNAKGLSKNTYNMKTAVDVPHFLQGEYGHVVAKGFELGALLGRKLMVRNEERSLVHNRLVSGHIDSKRLSHAGYGIETVFKQVHIDRYKQACLHISLDMSSSMGGRKWEETVQMCSAIVKAATYVQNLRIKVDCRATQRYSGSKDVPIVTFVYDSRYNDLRHFVDVMSALRPVATTPEGLCFDAIIRRGLIEPTTSECTSYFLNISDGEPGIGGWGGQQAIEYTRKQVQKMKNELGVNVLSFFVSESRSEGEPSLAFKTMYGRDARMVSAHNVTQIARELNAKFLTEGKYTV